MTQRPRLEICAFHIESCIIAEQEGAYRVELCDNPIEGGTTPSYGTIKKVREKIGIKLYPIIRPRSGNYFYTEDEFAILRQEIMLCKQLGCDGISVGVQNQDGTIDKDRFKKIVEWAGTMGVTCNRVFDCAPEPFEALEAIIECGCERVLTSGLKSAAPDAGKLLGELVHKASNRISIMPGAGVKSSNLAKLKEQSGAWEFHASARVAAPNPVTYINQQVSDYGHVYIADPAEVHAMIRVLNE
ncbi:MAG: copper homeostasis protein CutC [Bacteroidetes bacterium]|nr:copper homeostasis protein CutC [Bacteroidota bacterium]